MGLLKAMLAVTRNKEVSDYECLSSNSRLTNFHEIHQRESKCHNHGQYLQWICHLHPTIQDYANKILMVKRFPKSCKLIGSTLDEVHVFGDGLGTLDSCLELVLDLFDMPTRWMSICVGKGEP